MNKEQLEGLKEKLLAIRKDLLDGVSNVINHSNDEFGMETPDINDEASRTYSRQVLLSLGEADRKQLRLVDDALENIEKGEYGTCVDCEDDIPYSRLEAVPYVKRCVTCKTKYEEGLQSEQ